MKKKSENISRAGKRGVFLVDKPKGITSFDVIRRLREKTGVRKMGHAGTLDPLATGLLIVAAGEDTKKLSRFLGLPKEYEADILFGVRTDTGDMEGAVLEEADVSIAEEDIRRALAEMKGILRLPVPAYSAVKRGGEPLYRKARRGEKVAPPEKEMHVYRAELLFFRPPALRVLFFVGSGTYIRSLAEELGRRLGVPATLRDLRRTKIGDYTVDNAEKI